MITFTPHDVLSALLTQAKRDVQAWQEARGDDKQPPWSLWAGDQLEQLKRSRKATSDHLNAPETNLRLAAISLVAEHWLAGRQFASDVLRLAFHDAEPVIRGAALTALPLNAQHIVDATRTLRMLLAELFPSPTPRHSLRQYRLELMEHFLRKAFGEEGFAHLKPMFQSRSDAVAYLEHEDAEVRRAALVVLEAHCQAAVPGKPDEQFAKTCERLAQADRDTSIRSLALGCLGSLHAAAGNSRVEQLIAWIVFDSSEPLEVRKSAYRSLLEIRGRFVFGGGVRTLSASFRFPEDVDWGLVKSTFNSRL
jgi:hypothetical protein